MVGSFVKTNAKAECVDLTGSGEGQLGSDGGTGSGETEPAHGNHREMRDGMVLLEESGHDRGVGGSHGALDLDGSAVGKRSVNTSGANDLLDISDHTRGEIVPDADD